MIKRIKLVYFIDPGQINLPESTDLYSANDYFLKPLEENISKNGIISPLVIRENESGKWEVISGKRRLICARLLRLKYVPCIKIACSKQQAALLRLSERLCTSRENIFETADSLSNLVTNYSLDTSRIAGCLGIPSGEVKDKLKLLDFPFELRQTAAEHLSLTQILTLMILPKENLSAAMNEVIHNSLNESQTKELVASYFSPKKTEPIRKAAIGDLKIFSNSIEKLLTTIQNAGYETDFSIIDEGMYIDFNIKLRKRADMLENLSAKTG